MAKHHSGVEVATKLAQANRLARQGKQQSEIARTLGVSVMTLHRWRKAPPPAPQAAREADEPDWPRGGGTRLAELQLENSRLRRLVTDLLLETIKLKDAAQRPKIFGARGRRRVSLVIIEKRPDD
jgi:transposase-like protein